MARLDDFDPGGMRHRVTIQEQVQGAKDPETGEPAVTWTDLAGGTGIPAQIKPITGNEYWGAQAIQSGITHTVIMRWRSDLNATMRLVFGTRILAIQTPPQNWKELGQWMVVRCTEGINVG